MIEQSIDDGEVYRIVLDGKKVGGVVIKVEGEKGDLDLLFVAPSVHSKRIGYAAWCEVEKLHPEVKVWETVTPYFEQRNIHFYVNRCGFHIVEFFNKYHQDPNDPEMNAEKQDEQFSDGMFRFEKVFGKFIFDKGDGKYVVVYWWWNHNLCVRYVYLLKAGLNMEINRRMEILSCR